jgi:hypothetical protein
VRRQTRRRSNGRRARKDPSIPACSMSRSERARSFG